MVRRGFAVAILGALPACGEREDHEQSAQHAEHGPARLGHTVLDDFLPRYDVNEVHSIAIDATPAAVREAIRVLTAADVPVLVVLMAIRSLPSLPSRKASTPPRASRAADARG